MGLASGLAVAYDPTPALTPTPTPAPAAELRLGLDAGALDPQTAPRTLGLDLGEASDGRDGTPAPRLRMDLAAGLLESPPADRRTADQHPLTLESQSSPSGNGHPAPFFADPEELAAQRWDYGRSRMEVQLEGEQARLRAQGAVGSQGGSALMLSLPALRQAANALMRALRGRPQPMPRSEKPLHVRVREADHSTPAAIVVEPFVHGGTTESIHSQCDEAGSCRVEGLPAAPALLVVRGRGMVVLPYDGVSGEHAARLRPAATVTVEAPGCPGRRWRLVDAVTDVELPPPSPLDPDRDGWIEPGPEPLSMLAPAGTYRLEVEPPAGGSPLTITASEERTALVRLPSCPD